MDTIDLARKIQELKGSDPTNDKAISEIEKLTTRLISEISSGSIKARITDGATGKKINSHVRITSEGILFGAQGYTDSFSENNGDIMEFIYKNESLQLLIWNDRHNPLPKNIDLSLAKV